MIKNDLYTDAGLVFKKENEGEAPRRATARRRR